MKIRPSFYLGSKLDVYVERGVVYSVTYRCPTLGPDVEDVQDLFWTGETDTWGKITFHPVDGGLPLYLFPHELVSVENYSSYGMNGNM